jgi:hypothetical protein
MVWATTQKAKSLLRTHGIDDPNFELRHVLAKQAVTLTKCREARKALTCGANGRPLEAIIRGLTACGVNEALALRICGVDSDGSAFGALRRWREAGAAKRMRDAGDESDVAGTSAAKAARLDGRHMRRVRMLRTTRALLHSSYIAPKQASRCGRERSGMTIRRH